MDNAKINVIGNVTSSEIKNSPNQNESKSFVKFSIAVSTSAKDQQGNFITNFYNIVQFGKTSQSTFAKIQKGTQVFVSGYLQLVPFTKNDGTTTVYNNIVANDILVLQRAKGTGGVVPGAPAVQMQDISETSVDDIFGIDFKI